MLPREVSHQLSEDGSLERVSEALKAGVHVDTTDEVRELDKNSCCIIFLCLLIS